MLSKKKSNCEKLHAVSFISYDTFEIMNFRNEGQSSDCQGLEGVVGMVV